MAKAIMIQGTASSAGKSLIATGLCRVFSQDGYSVAPFKSQNMSLNSFITLEGLEMGRAQVVQAEAARVTPTVSMNPILLKPHSDTGSQVIVGGEVLGVMPAAEYYRRKPELVPIIKSAYDSLAEKHDIIVIEGAGSPSEINLNENDIVNMGMAKIARSPVLLVGDIDRGGVFAAVYGTVGLFSESERDMVKGIIINKFRGDKNLLQPGLRMLEGLVNKPVLGVVPWLSLQLEEEDSLSERFMSRGRAGMPEIAIVRPPRIANFSDFTVLERNENLSAYYVHSKREWGRPSLVVLPGSKNTMEDLLWLRETGLESLILKHAEAGGAVFGICGGYQMLGESLSDPEGIEHGGEMRGIGLLPVKTVFHSEKVRTRVRGKVLQIGGLLSELSEAEAEGYEVHMGRSERHGGAPLCNFTDIVSGESKQEGCQSGSVYGTYAHGFFDSPAVSERIVTALCRENGITPQKNTKTMAEQADEQYDALALALRDCLDMKSIYKIIEDGV